MTISDSKPIIHYPCLWQYTLIGEGESRMREAVSAALQDLPYRLDPSKTSLTGKYCSLALELTVQTEAQRLDIYHLLCQSPMIRIVI